MPLHIYQSQGVYNNDTQVCTVVGQGKGKAMATSGGCGEGERDKAKDHNPRELMLKVMN